jgi:biotin carboxylase
MEKCILIIGVRKKCYKAALELGHKVILWSDEKLNEKRKVGLSGWIEEPYKESSKGLSPNVVKKLREFSIKRVISNTEETVVLGALVREHLKLKRLAVDVTERFHDKLKMKDFATKFNIPITKYKLIENDTTAEDLADYLKLPLVIKPVDDSGARDVKIAQNLPDLKKYMSKGLLAEAFVEGSEVSVETFVQNGKPILHNITEYLHQWRKSAIPAKLELDLEKKILELNDKIIENFGVDRGMTHAEFYLTKDGPVFGEIAIRPPGGYYMEVIEKVYGIDSWKLYVNLSCGSKIEPFDATPKGCGAVYMIHPGAGKILSIEGVEEIKQKVKGIFEISIRKKVGDIILEHESTSNEVGHILFWSPNRQQLDEDLKYIESTLKYNLEKK